MQVCPIAQVRMISIQDASEEGRTRLFQTGCDESVKRVRTTKGEYSHSCVDFLALAISFLSFCQRWMVYKHGNVSLYTESEKSCVREVSAITTILIIITTSFSLLLFTLNRRKSGLTVRAQLIYSISAKKLVHRSTEQKQREHEAVERY